MKIEEIVTLIQAVAENGLTSFEYEEGEQKLTLKKKTVTQAPVVIAQPAAMPMTAQMPVQMPVEMPVQTAPADTQATMDIGSDHVILSPLVGTFYSSSSPEADVFVKVGDSVKKGQVLGIIEAMKLMNEIESDFDGVVEAILVNNEDVVEYGQPLFRIR